MDIDSLVKPTDIIFFDGQYNHSTDKIVAYPGKEKIGRIATFAIPTYFRTLKELPATFRKMENLAYRIIAKLKSKSSYDY